MPRNHASPRFRSGRPPRSDVAISASGRKTSGYVFAETASASTRTRHLTPAHEREQRRRSEERGPWVELVEDRLAEQKRRHADLSAAIARRRRDAFTDASVATRRRASRHRARPSSSATRARSSPAAADEEEQRLRERRILVEEAAVRPQPRRHSVPVAVVLVDVAERPVRERPALREQRAHDEEQRAAGGDAERVARAPQRRSLFYSMSNHIAKSVNWMPEISSSATSTIVRR